MKSSLYSKAPRKRNLVLNKDIKLGQELARGGEGKIYAVSGRSQVVAKIFHNPTPEKDARISVMLNHPPRDYTRKKLKHFSIAWPTARILDSAGRCIGFTMPYIDKADNFPLLKLYNPADRRSMGISFTWEYLLRMMQNLASIIAALHRSGYVIGDLNESNILVTRTALVTLVDCDSIQVPKPRPVWKRILLFWMRDYFRCTVGKPEYTPPELQGCDFKLVNRKKYHDNFGLAVLIFLMLMEGWHPFASSWKGEGNAPTLEEDMKEGIFPYVGDFIDRRPKYGLPLNILPPALYELMIKCFIDHHLPGHFGWPAYTWRPTATRWCYALAEAQGLLTQCSQNSSHVYSEYLDRCPWCERVRQGIPDPFPPPAVPVAQPTRAVQTRTRRRRVRSVRKRVKNGFFALLSLLLYGIEGYGLFFTGHWFVQETLQFKSIALILAFFIPLFIYLYLAFKYRSY